MWAPKHPSYKTFLARDILTRVRKGETLLRILEDEGMPDILEVLAWIKDLDLKYWNRTFHQAYQDALLDQAFIWREQAINMIDQLEEGATTTDIARAKAKAELLLKMSKEQGSQDKIARRGHRILFKQFSKPKMIAETPETLAQGELQKKLDQWGKELDGEEPVPDMPANGATEHGSAG